jgi:endonuclease/exonuclease/phosphatase family metal-dependent hydrolase
MKFKIMTFNLRYDKPDPGMNAWTVRKAAVGSSIAHFSPDLIGTQEGLTHQLDDIQQLRPEYQRVGGDRDGSGYGEYCAIFYHSQRWKCLDTQDFWLSDTPETPGSVSADWGNPLPRMVTWGRFESLTTGNQLILFNTHLDYQSAQARELGSKLICDRMAQVFSQLGSDAFMFLTGDFNDRPSSQPRKLLCHQLPNQTKMQDVLSNLSLEEQMTFHDFTGHAFDPVDTIYYDRRVKLSHIKIDRSQTNGIWPSDHFPVIAELLL